MLQSLELTVADRVLFFAPHPDDESLGGGGLVQKAVAVGAQMRFVFVTNGDRNPWPQRVMERSVFLDAKARRRWGARRRQEALNALAILGIGEPAEAHFLGWPDQGVTPLLMRGDAEALEIICRQIAEWQPSYIITPAAEDVHPDHSAFFVLVQLALCRLRRRGIVVRHVVSYVVHAPKTGLALAVRPVALSPAEKAVKADAIQAHETQMLSRRRFLAHARDVEPFYRPLRPEAKHPHHPIVTADQGRGALRLKLKLPKPFLSFRGATLFIVLETLLEGSLRWSLALPGSSARVLLIDTVTGQPLRRATVRIAGRSATIHLPIASAQPLTRLFAKFDRRRVFFDTAGWRELPVDLDRGPKVRLHRFGATTADER
ncbi:MAG: PIG-L family deacetylase [Chthoniobacter sp.]|nr:PIG-L family deacetylase [Chthoniobacter sp.]